MTDFYESIAPWYDRLFPVDAAAAAFAASRIGTASGASVLDAGCGTGGLAAALAESGFRVTGIDSDAAMVRLASEKGRGLPNIRFEVLDLRDAATRFAPASFDAVICFGNTLVHLAAPDEVERFIRGAAGLLRGGGPFLVQILNYDRILDRDVTALPVLGDGTVRFERAYRRDAGSERLWFRTALTVESASVSIENEVPLLPLRKQWLAGAFERAGFQGVEWYGDFSGGPLTDDSFPLITVGRLKSS
jgi:glycine/sarcosine N-methyltransferase